MVLFTEFFEYCQAIGYNRVTIVVSSGDIVSMANLSYSLAWAGLVSYVICLRVTLCDSISKGLRIIKDTMNKGTSSLSAHNEP